MAGTTKRLVAIPAKPNTEQWSEWGMQAQPSKVGVDLAISRRLS